MDLTNLLKGIDRVAPKQAAVPTDDEISFDIMIQGLQKFSRYEKNKQDFFEIPK